MLHIVDNEEAIRDSLSWLASSRGMAVRSYESAEALSAAIAGGYSADPQGDCLLLDVRMPGKSGVTLFDELAQRNLTRQLPVIFITGHGDVPMAVDALKRGAFDFFEKPFDDNKLMDRVIEAFAASRQAAEAAVVQARLATLSLREREVMELVIGGKLNKVIADELGISMRTVEVHRANILDKMHVKTAVELARLLD
ncbi:MAG TPA: response regulator [Burkholderiaceae bacterium]